MAGSTVETVGSIFSRVRGMLLAGAVKWEERPLWFDVYSRFPPKYEPRFNREPPENCSLRKLIYPEDEIRAQFYKTFGSPGLINLTDDTTPSLCETFLSKYVDMAKKDPNREADELFADTEAALSQEGVVLRRKAGATAVENSNATPKV